MRIAFTFFCFTLSFLSNAQPAVKFTHLTNLDGLSQSTVQAIVKDKYGFLWFGTQDGLNRYDGYQFKVYRHSPKNPASLRRSHITKLYEDRLGNLWVGTSNGALSLYDRKKDAFIHYKEMIDGKEGLSQKTVTAIYEDKQNNFWIGTYWKLNLLDRKTGKITQYGHDPSNPSSLSSDGITCIFEDSRNKLWIGTSNGLNIFDRKTKKFTRYFHTDDNNSISENFITAIKEDAKGRLWIGTNNGLNLFDHRTGTFERFQYDPADVYTIGDNQIAEIEDAGDGNLWIGTKTYLEYFNIEKNVFTHFKSKQNVSTSLSKNGNVTALYRDKEGILWVGTYQGGINKHDPHLTFFDTYSNNPNDLQSLSFNIVTSFAQKEDGNIWIGTGGGALNLWDRASNTFQRFNPDPANKASLSNWGILSLCQSRKSDYLWIGTYGSGMDRYDPKTNTFRHYTKGDSPLHLSNDAVYAIYEDSRGNVWMGTNGGGVNVLDPVTGVITRFLNDPNNSNSVASNYIRCFYEDRNGSMWIGGTGGVSVYHPKTKSFFHYNQSNTSLESDVIFAFLEDSKGNMWIGTLGGGLVRLESETKRLKCYTTDEGLPDNTVNSIIEDERGFIWVSTNNGIGQLDPVKGTFKNKSIDNGIQSFEFSQGAGIKTKKGEIMFGGINGFNMIDPTHLIENKNIPPVVITGFRLFNKQIIPEQKESPLNESIIETKEIRLSHDQSIITFEFAALGFTASQKNQYAYKLEGFDAEWIFAGTNRKATYTNLPPGEYTFRVKAANNDNVWNEAGTSVRIIIKPPFWQTWWFRCLVAVTVTTGVVLLYKARIKSIQAQKLLLKQQVRERTESLAKMTLEEKRARREADEANKELERKNRELEQFAYVASHDLQEPLRTTSSFVELLQHQYKGKIDEKADKYLTFISQASDRMKVLVNDLLDYSRIGKKKDLAKVDCNLVVREVLADLGAAIREANADISVGPLPVIYAYPTEIKQVFQNLVINAIKFRKKDTCPRVEINGENIGDYWQFSVRDNGIGIDEKHNERIFIIFQRLHTRNEYQGSGIGLSHCKKIAELHKGKIWVTSKPGEGSNFYFTIHQTENAEVS